MLEGGIVCIWWHSSSISVIKEGIALQRIDCIFKLYVKDDKMVTLIKDEHKGGVDAWFHFIRTSWKSEKIAYKPNEEFKPIWTFWWILIILF
jgi:hypothetical protein